MGNRFTSIKWRNNVLKKKHTWVQTGKINEVKCLVCGIVKQGKNPPIKFYIDNIEVENSGCK